MERVTLELPSQKLTARPPKNGWLGNDFPFGKPYFQVLLLIEEILHHLGCINPCKLIMVDSPYQLVIAGFLNHQQVLVVSGFGYRVPTGTPVKHREGLHLWAAVAFFRWCVSFDPKHFDWRGGLIGWVAGSKNGHSRVVSLERNPPETNGQLKMMGQKKPKITLIRLRNMLFKF